MQLLEAKLAQNQYGDFVTGDVVAIADYPDLMKEVWWVEASELSAAHKMTLNLWLVVEAGKRDGLTYEDLKKKYWEDCA